MSAVYDIAKRAVNAYINTGSVPHYVATQVERDVEAWAERQIREARAKAWEEGKASGFRDAYTDSEEEEPNPYRAAK